MRASCVIIFLLIQHLFSVTSVKSHHDTVNDPLKVNILKPIIYGDENCIDESEESTEPLEYEIPCGLSNVSDLVSDRIVGGETAQPYEFPWLVSIQLFKNGKYEDDHNCGGSIVHSLFILTAAHCTYNTDINALLILAGKFELSTHEDHEQARGVINAFYKDYDNLTFKNDIALLKLNASLKLELYFVGPVCLPEGNIEFDEKGVVAGWGRLYNGGPLSNVLKKVTMDIIDINTCRKIYEKTEYSNQFHKCQICTSHDNKNACKGDSGGPLMGLDEKDDEKVYINGIVSWGGCAARNLAAVYTEVACFIKWIKINIARETQK